MNSYKVKGIILAVIISLASIMMPFSVYADTISNSNVNINYYLDSVTEISSGSYLQTYTVEFIFDQSYLGWISSKMVGTYINNNTLPTTTSQFTITKAIYVNGTIASTSVSFTTPNTIANGALQSLSQSIQNSNVTPLADLSTLDDILNVLTDIHNIIEIDVLSELESIVTNTSLANDYLEIISNIRRYDFPFESFSFVHRFFLLGYEDIGIAENSYYQYPVFRLPSNTNIIVQNRGTNKGAKVIFACNEPITSESAFNTYFNYTGTITNYKVLFSTRVLASSEGSRLYSVVSIDLINKTNQFIDITISPKNPIYFIPIYSCQLPVDSYNVSTEFALQFGLTNSFLDNIEIIAAGTNQSNQAASDLENEASEYSDIADDVIGVEEGLTSNFETEVNKIDLNTGLNVFGGNFMTSATWVRTQFDRLTENTPYGSLVVYGLTLGFALLMLGKVLL